MAGDLYRNRDQGRACRRLWCAVLLRLIADLRLQPAREHSVWGVKEADAARKDAERFFDYPDRNFYEVCALAGVSAEALLEAYRSGRLTRNQKDLAT